jgi:hypothetical protein
MMLTFIFILFLCPKTDTKETQHIPYGLCIWSTGIGTSPLINKIREKLPQDIQTNRRALLTDQFLRVKVTHPLLNVACPIGLRTELVCRVCAGC